MSRLLRTIPPALLLVIAVGSSVAAKTPPFEVTLSSNSANAGSAITVTVTVDEGPRWEGFVDHNKDLNGVLGLFPAVEVGPDGRPRAGTPAEVEPALRRTSDGGYEGVLDLPNEPGEYLLVAFPDTRRELSAGARAAYPDPIAVSVVPAGAGRHGAFDGTPAALMVVLVIAVTMAVALKVRRRRAAAA